MAENAYTQEHHRAGVPGQVILDAGLNVFALELLVESFTQLAGEDTKPVEFPFRGVKVSLQIDR